MPPNSNQIELVCKACGETNPPKFQVCWKCGKSLVDAERIRATEWPDDDEIVDNEETDEQIESPVAFGRLAGWCELIAVLLVTCFHVIWANFLYGSSGQREVSAAYLARSVPWYAGMTVILWVLVRRDQLVPQPKAIFRSAWGVELVYSVLILMANWLIRVAILSLTVDLRGPNEAHVNDVTFTSNGIEAAYYVSLFFWALYEEVLFRVYLQMKLQSLLGGKALLPIILSAIVFAAAHDYPLRLMIVVFATGVCYGVVYQYSRRVPRLVLAHWMHNLLVLWMHYR